MSTLAPEMVEEAKRLLPGELAGRVLLPQVADGASLPFGGRRFDLVVLQNMIPFFEELSRVTAPGGRAIFAFSRGAETPIWVPPRSFVHGWNGSASATSRNSRPGKESPSLPRGKTPVRMPAKRRPRRGSTGPDVVFRV